jgi:alpha-amylase
MHHQKIQDTFDCEPVVFKNTELIYNNELAGFIAAMGYKGILCEGLESILNGRTPNQTYTAPANDKLGVLLRNTRLSDDIAFRFDDITWSDQPMTAEKFAGWIHGHEGNSNIINLYFDYETFGIHKKKRTGIFEFLQNLPALILSRENWIFKTPSEVLQDGFPKDIFDAPQIISWQNKSFENCIWSENAMQRNALHKIYQIENTVLRSSCARSLKYWGHLQSADHFQRMSEKGSGINGVISDLNEYQSADEIYRQYKDRVTAFELHLIQQGLEAFRETKCRERSYHLYAGAVAN